MPNQLSKQDVSSTLQAAQQIAGQIQQQADKGEVDAALIAQLNQALNVQLDQSSSVGSSMGSANSGSGSSGSSSDSSSGSSSGSDSGSDSAQFAASGHGASISTPGKTTPNGVESDTFTQHAPSASGSSATPTGSGGGGHTNTGDTRSDNHFGHAQGAGELAKNDPYPAASAPPVPNVFVPGATADDQALIPQIISALEGGSLRKAQSLVRNEWGTYDQGRFNRVVNMSMRAVMTEMGLTAKNLRKIHAGATMGLEEFESAMGKGSAGALAKNLSASDIPGIYLIKLAKLMLPLYAGLVRRLPADTPATGADKAQWRAQIGFQNVNWANLMSVAEAAIGDTVNESFLTFASYYRDIAQNDIVTLKAQAASRGYDDPLQVSLIRLMTIILQGQERKVLGDNFVSIGAPGVPLAVAGGAGTLGGAGDKFWVSALTYRGYSGNAHGHVLAGADAQGESTATISLAVNLAAAANVTLSWAPVPGAVAYNIFYDVAGAGGAARHYVATTSLTKITLTALPAASTNVPNTADQTANANGYDSLMSWCLNSTVGGNVIPNKVAPTDLKGLGFTTGSSGINEIDAILEQLWRVWQISPSLFVISPKGASKLTDKLLSLNSAQLYRINVETERNKIQGGAMVTSYGNKFAPFADGSQAVVDILPHPYMPDGMMLILCEDIPYPMARENRGFARDVLIPYTYFPLAQTTIAYPFAVTESETVECFHPAVQTAIIGGDWTV